MKYINKKTGVILETESVMLGAWEEYNPSKQEEKIEIEDESEDKETKEDDEKTDNHEELTVAQIKQELDAFGIEYPKRATKAELLKIIEDMKE